MRIPLLLAFFCTLAASRAATPRYAESARPAPAIAGAPHHSDVIMRSLEPHPRNARDPHDTLQAARDFHLTRLEWVYGPKAPFVEQAKKLGLTLVGGTLSNAEPDEQGSLLHGRVTGEDSQLKTCSWFPQGRWVGCANAPEYRAAWQYRARAAVDAGAEVLQQDDPHMAVRATSLCYCKYCRAAFATYQAEHGASASYEQFQKDSVLAFHREMHAALDAYAGHHVPFSHNNTLGFSGSVDWTAPAFDYIEAELGRGDPAWLEKICAAAREAGLPAIFQFRGTTTAANRRTLALLYAQGAIMLLPWDVYLPDNAPRYFGTPADYADLTGFIRANARWLDGYESAAPLETEGVGASVKAYLRARPGEPEAPVVIHLVETGDHPTPCTLHLSKARLFGNREVKATLRLPTAYDAAEHRQAQETGDFSPLSEETTPAVSSQGDALTISIPALAPWGMLVLGPVSAG